jgi:hypothetical protein
MGREMEGGSGGEEGEREWGEGMGGAEEQGVFKLWGEKIGERERRRGLGSRQLGRRGRRRETTASASAVSGQQLQST